MKQGLGCQAKELDWIQDATERPEQGSGQPLPTRCSFLRFPSPTPEPERGPGPQAIRGSWPRSAEQALSGRLT